MGKIKVESLKIARVKKGWTQEDLSKIANVSRVSICNIERKGIDTIPVRTLRKLAAALDITVHELFFPEEQDNPI